MQYQGFRGCRSQGQAAERSAGRRAQCGNDSSLHKLCCSSGEFGARVCCRHLHHDVPRSDGRAPSGPSLLFSVVSLAPASPRDRRQDLGVDKLRLQSFETTPPRPGDWAGSRGAANFVRSRQCCNAVCGPWDLARQSTVHSTTGKWTLAKGVCGRWSDRDALQSSEAEEWEEGRA